MLDTGAHGSSALLFARHKSLSALDVLVGVRYLVRHDPAQKLYGVALFGEAGPTAAVANPASWSGSDGPIMEDLVEEARRLFGYRIVPTP